MEFVKFITDREKKVCVSDLFVVKSPPEYLRLLFDTNTRIPKPTAALNQFKVKTVSYRGTGTGSRVLKSKE